jgi:hypothetical protein
MKTLFKWLIKKVNQVDVVDVIGDLFPKKWCIDFICDLLGKLALKTKTKLDDEFVVGLRRTLYEIFKVE